MSKKYRALGEYLSKLPSEPQTLSFNRIEQILGSKLPASARDYDAWWSNSPVPGRHNSVWLEAGWQTDCLNRNAGSVSFIKSDLRQPASRASNNGSSTTSVNTKLRTSPILPGVAVNIGVEWKELGAVTKRGVDGIDFPSVGAIPGLYRFRFALPEGLKVYIGETVNLQRRFAHYRRPGPTQQTNIRIKQSFVECISRGSNAAADIIIGGVSLKIGGESVAADLHNKAIRRLLENAAGATLSGEVLEISNL